MFCSECGTPIHKDGSFCGNCGKPVPGSYTTRKTSAMPDDLLSKLGYITRKIGVMRGTVIVKISAFRKQIIAVAVLALAVVAVAAIIISISGRDRREMDSTLVGRWRDGANTLELLRDGTAEMIIFEEGREVVSNPVWATEDGRLILTNYKEYNYEVADYHLRLTIHLAGDDVILTRIHSYDRNSPYEGIVGGTWNISGFSSSIRFFDDGTGILRNIYSAEETHFNWSIEDNWLTTRGFSFFMEGNRSFILLRPDTSGSYVFSLNAPFLFLYDDIVPSSLTGLLYAVDVDCYDSLTGKWAEASFHDAYHGGEIEIHSYYHFINDGTGIIDHEGRNEPFSWNIVDNRLIWGEMMVSDYATAPDGSTFTMFDHRGTTIWTRVGGG